MNRLIQYIIKAKDATSDGISSAINRVKKFGSAVATHMTKAKTNLDTTEVKEKFIRTTNVLDAIGRALDRFGVSGEEFNDVYDTMKKRLDDFNRTGEGADALFQHFKMSMEEYCKTSKQVEDGLAMLKRNMIGAGESGKELAKGLKSDFRGVHAVISAVEGNVFAAGRAFVWMLGHIKKLNLSAAALQGISLSVFAITEVVSKAVQWWNDYKTKQEEIQNLRFENTLKQYTEAQKECNSELSKYERQLDREIERKKKLIDQNSRLAQQELETARLKAVEGKTGVDRDQINKDFEAQKAQIKAEADLAKAQVDVEAQTNYDEYLKKLEAKLAPKKETMAKQLAELDAQVKKEEDKAKASIANKTTGSGQFQTTQWGSFEYQRKLNETEKQAAFEEWQASNEDYRKLKEKRDKLKDGYDDIVADLEDFAAKRQKAADKAEDAKNEANNIVVENDLNIWKDEEERMHDYYEMMATLEEDAAREAQRAAEEEHRLKMKMERELHNERVRNTASELKQSEELQREAMSRLTEAQSKIRQAWGFYKDKNAMQSYRDEAEKEIAAKKQWEKDAKKLESGGLANKYDIAKDLNRAGKTDELEEMFAKWRKGSFGLSLEQEATMRVGIAKDEEQQAKKSLEGIQKNTEHLKSILEILKSGGEAE